MALTAPLSLGRLAIVKSGMTLEAIREQLGPPARHHDNGTHVLEYPLQDGSRAEIVYANPRLIKINLYRPDGRRVTWVPAS